MAVRGRNQRFNKEAQKNSAFGKAISAGLSDNNKQLMNAIEFIEGPMGLGIRLRPVQRVITKCIFGVPLDYRPEWADRIPGWGMVEMWDVFRKNLIRTVTEEDYLKITYSEGRCNVDDWRDIPDMGNDRGIQSYNEACIFAGRRGGKSELVAAITSYKLYLLLNLRSPQEYFGLVPGSPIDITYLAQDEKGADRLFKKLREDVNRCSFFETFFKDNNAKALTFVCEADRHKTNITPTLTVWSLPCTTNAVRGPSSVMLALDEFAHFRSEKGSTSEDMYASATPATGDFHHIDRHWEDGSYEPLPPTTNQEVIESADDVPEEIYQESEETNSRLAGKSYNDVDIQDSMIFSISSPLKRVGQMYELHKMALNEGVKSTIFTLNCPSAEMNNKLLPKFLESEFRKNTVSFKAEYGGQFLESSESYLTEVAVKACVDVQWDDRGLAVESTARTNIQHFDPNTQLGRNYFWGFDLGMTNDASALAIAHLEFSGSGGIKLVYDYIDRMMVGEHFEGPGIIHTPGDGKYEQYKILDMQDILRWLRAINRIMPCFRGATDQHGGQQLVQLLEVNEISNMELLNLTPAINSQMAYALRGYVENNLCSFPYVPKFIKELKLVELEVASKYRIRVQAPMEKGSHDDMVDAAQLCALLAQKWLIDEGNLHLDPSGLSLLMQSQQNKTATPIACLDGVPMQTLRSMEKLKQVERHIMGGTSVSPFFHRGGRRGR